MAKTGSMGEHYKLKRVLKKTNVYFELDDVDGQPQKTVNRFLETVLLNGNSDKTAAVYGYDLLHFYTWLDEAKIKFEDITEDKLYDYIKHQRKQKAAPRSINHRLCTAMQFYKFCFDREMPGGRYVLRPVSFYKGQNMPPTMGILPRRKAKKKLRVRVPKTLIKPLEIEEVKTFIRSVKKHRDLAIVYLMLSCGLRSMEVINIKKSDISYFTREVVVRGKGGKERLIYLPDFIIGILDKYHQLEKPQISDSYHLFVVLKGKTMGKSLTRSGLRETFRYKRKISGIDRANPHRFRHTCGADLVRAGVSLRVIQKILGHEDINQTITYTNIFQQDVKEEVFKAYKKLGNRYA